MKVSQMAEDILRVENLVKHFPIGSSFFARKGESLKLRAVDRVSFSIPKGGTLGLVGESGSGKSTTARLITRLIEPTAGKVYFQGQDILSLSSSAFRKIRPRIQMVFQDPYASLNPRLRIRSILGTPLRLHQMVPPAQIQDRVVDLLEMVGLEADHRDGYPHQFSGGQRQRISIARAMALEPVVIIADEPVSALDVSVRAQILNLLRRLQESQGVSYLLIAHDLSVVRHFCDRVVVMYGGKIVEEASAEELFGSPLHPYTEVLLSAIPTPESRFSYQPQFLKGESSSLIHRREGCVLHQRCPLVESQCREGEVAWEEKKPGHWVACHFR